MEEYYRECRELAEAMEKEGLTQEQRLFRDSLLLQAEIHYKSLLAQKRLCRAYSDSVVRNQQEKAFVEVGEAILALKEILSAMEEADHGKWKGFYDNDCLTDVKYTAYILEKVMGYIRNLGDGPHYYQWALKYMYPGMDHKVVLITNMRNHPRDWELFEAMQAVQSAFLR